MILEDLSLLAVNSSIKAGLEIMKIYESDDFNITNKNDQSPLTKADTAANIIILKELELAKLPYITEEIKASSYEYRKDWRQCWIIDPLDGTKEFIKRNGEFTVNIALIENNKPVLGVIYVPVSGDIYFGNVEHKTYVKSNNTSAFESYEEFVSSHIPVDREEISTSIKVVGSKSHMNYDTKVFIDKLISDNPNKQVEVVSKGSSLKFCMIADGEADIYPRFAPTMEWDTAAGQAICEAAGYVVIDQKTQKCMKYNREELLNSYFLVTRKNGQD